MSNLLNRLVKNGYISKRKDDTDARSVLVKFTPKGLELMDKAMKIQASCEQNITQVYSHDEKILLAELLRKLQPEYFE